MVGATTNYRVRARLDPFYTGGALSKVSADGSVLACACGDEVKVRAELFERR
jgi:hypothetical protein